MGQLKTMENSTSTCKLISATEWLGGDWEMARDDIVAWCARVSNPENQNNHKTSGKLLRYLLNHKHFSPFEMVNMCIEIKTSRGIAAQILRHRSFTFQEFSLRYSTLNTDSMVYPTMRNKGSTNRQGSTNDSSDKMQQIAREAMDAALQAYLKLLEGGVAPESARFVLPLATPTTLYMSGTLRSWLHYIELRSQPNVQAEHRDIAMAARDILGKAYPVIGQLLMEGV